ncbi:MAG: hypothetical protein ACON5H_02410 [Akkermansiaceae bacterium]
MKILHIAPPALALIASGVWLGLQQREISNLEIKTTIMRDRIGKIEDTFSQENPTGSQSSRKKDGLPPGFLLENGNLDWTAVARFFAENNRGGGGKDLRTLVQIQKKLSTMEVEDLIKTIRLIKRLEMPPAHRESLDPILAGFLIQKDPQRALDFYKLKLGEEHTSLSWQLRNAVAAWAKNDPAAALAWFDEQKAAGVFESKKLSPHSEVENAFGAQVYSALLESDPAQIEARLRGMGEDDRRALLHNSSLWLGNSKNESAYYDLVRRHLSEDSQKDVIGNGIALSLIKGGSLKSVSEKLATSAFSQEERQAGLDKVAAHFARPWNRKASDLKKIYLWFGKEDPERQTELTAKTYAQFGNHRNTDFEETFRELSSLAEEVQNSNLVPEFAARLDRPEQQLSEIKDEGLKASLSQILANLPPENAE